MKAWQFWAVYSGVTALVYYLSTENLQAPLFFLASLVVSSLIFRWFTREQRREERLRLLCLALWMGRDVAPGLTGAQLGSMAGLLPGTVSPYLAHLKEKGWILGRTVGPKTPGKAKPRYYQLTEQGKAAVAELLFPQLSNYQKLTWIP
jgi:predicted transcriptional regulator